MRVRITRLPSDVGRLRRDEPDLSRYAVGEEYEVGPVLGSYLVVMGLAVPEMDFATDSNQSSRGDGRGQQLDDDERTASATRSTVLLVDDVLDQLDMYEMALEGSFRVLRASRGHEAFELAGRASPDIIVLDVRMPDLNGVTLCQKLKSTPATAAIPVLLLTAYPSYTIKEHAKHAGAADVLSKPCPSERLLLAINDVLSRANR